MRGPLTLLVIAALTLSACGSRLNPFNWFGQSRSESVERTEDANPLIPERSALKQRDKAPLPGPLVARVTGLSVARVAGGAVIRAEGLAPGAGAFDVALLPRDGAEAGTLVFELRAKLPPGAAGTGAETGRRVVAARSVSNQDLQGIRNIEVVARDNLRRVRR